MKKDTLIGWGVIGAVVAVGAIAYAVTKDEKTKKAIKDVTDKVKGFFN